MLAPLGCGGGDQTPPTPTARGPRVTTQRPQLAYFTTHGHAVYDLGLADDRGQHRQVLSGESRAGTITPQLFTGISWAPDGTRLVIAGSNRSGPPREHADLYTIDGDGSAAKRVTDVGDAAAPLWSPDGKTIIFTRTSGGEGSPIKDGLWSIEDDGSGLTQIVEANDWEIYMPGSFTPDGSKLAVTRSTLDPNTGRAASEIELMNPDGSDIRPLIDRARDPAYSPDGRRLVFTSDRDRNGQLCYGDSCSYGGELYAANADGSDPTRLTNTNGLNEAHPSWSPDGSRIAYQRGEVFQNAEATSILETNPDGSCTKEILAGSGPGPWYASPAWRPSDAGEGERGPCNGR